MENFPLLTCLNFKLFEKILFICKLFLFVLKFETNTTYIIIIFFFFLERCQVEPTLGFYPLNSTSFGFRYRAFRFDTTDSVYIHCDAFVCLKSEKHNIDDCDRTCNSTRIHRGKREASREIFHLVSKPIQILRRKDKMDGQTNELESHLSK